MSWKPYLFLSRDIPISILFGLIHEASPRTLNYFVKCQPFCFLTALANQCLLLSIELYEFVPTRQSNGDYCRFIV